MRSIRTQSNWVFLVSESCNKGRWIYLFKKKTFNIMSSGFGILLPTIECMNVLFSVVCHSVHRMGGLPMYPHMNLLKLVYLGTTSYFFKLHHYVTHTSIGRQAVGLCLRSGLQVIVWLSFPNSFPWFRENISFN